MIRKRSWKLYSDVRSRLMKITPDYHHTGGIDRTQYLRGLDVNMSEDAGYIEVKAGKMFYAENIRHEILTFQYDTYSKNMQHYHLMQVNDVNGNRSILIQRRKWFLNREVHVFAHLTHAFLQGLHNYATNQSLCESLAQRYGVPTRYVPIGLGFSIEDWEKEFNVPSLGTDDILGSYMNHVYNGRLKLDGKPLFDS